MTPTIALDQINSAIKAVADFVPESTTYLPDNPTPSTMSSSANPKTLSEGETLVLSLSRVGTPTQSIRSGTVASLAAREETYFGGPLHSLVIVGRRVHPMEIQYAAQWAVDADEWWSVAEKYYGVARETPP